MTLKSFVDSIFTATAFDGVPLVAASSLGAALAAPEGTQISQYLAWAESLPDRNPTSWLNLAESSAKAIASANGKSSSVRLTLKSHTDPSLVALLQAESSCETFARWSPLTRASSPSPRRLPSAVSLD